MGRLKYELCFLKVYKEALLEIKEKDKLLDPSHMANSLKHVKTHFPYEKNEELKRVQQKVLANVISGLDPGLAYLYIKERFSKYIENISSPSLFHFTKSPFLLIAALKKKELFPTVVYPDEYKPQNSSPLSVNKVYEEVTLKYSDAFRKLARDLKDNPDRSYSHAIQDNNLLPVCSCFTEMPLDSLIFHAHQYGFYGIAFKKNILIPKNNPHEGREGCTDEGVIHGFYPVSYVCSSDNMIIPLLLEKILTATDEHEMKKYYCELMKIKPIEQHDLLPENFYSVYFEREWRYISNKKVFGFEYPDIEAVFLPANEWDAVNAVRNEPLPKEHFDKNFYEILEIISQNGIKVHPVKNILAQPS